MSQSLPNRWTTIMARVFGVMARSISSGSIFMSSASISTKTGTPPKRAMELAVEKNV